MKKIILGSVVTIALITGLFLSVGQYKAWRQERLVERAESYFKNGDLKNAALCAQQAVAANPSDARACATMADLAELAGNTNAFFWRSRVAELSSDPLAKLLLARTALTLGNPTLAAETLSKVAPEAKQSVEFHKLAANIAWGELDLTKAKLHFQEAMRLEPTNLVSRMNLAMLRLASTNNSESELGRNSLLSLAEQPRLKPAILRQLVQDAAKRGDSQTLLTYSEQLVNVSSNRADQLQHLAVLIKVQPKQFHPFLGKVKQQCGTNAFEVAVLGRWLVSQQLQDLAWEWFQTHPPALSQERTFQQALAEILVARKDWRRVNSELVKLNWAESDHMRLLMLSRAAKEQNNAIASRSHWLRAFKLAQGNLSSLTQIARTAEIWNWNDEMDEALGAIVQTYPEQRWAADYLGASLHRAGKTLALQNLFTRVLERSPTNHLAKSNVASLGMLLDPHESKFHRMALEAFKEEPNNPFIISSYAFSLHYQRKTAQGIELMKAIPKDKLEIPGIAFYYGWLLAQIGQSDSATKYLSLAEKGTLLPEERKLKALLSRNG